MTIMVMVVTNPIPELRILGRFPVGSAFSGFPCVTLELENK